MDIPPDLQIKSSIKPGSVYYFSDEKLTSKNPHFFVVINRDPLSDAVLLLLCASSKIEKKRMWYSACPSETLVEVSPTQYRDFTVPTIINCNVVFDFTISQLIAKRASGLLYFKTEMDISIIEELRKGVLASPTVEHKFKALLR